MKTIPLNIMLSYPVTWKKEQILRDLVQNFYDDVGRDNFENAFKTEYDRVKGVATLNVAGKGFSYEWLMHMGASTKQDHDGTFAGFFGEGFKMAALCALRDFNWKINMRSRDWRLEVITQETFVDGRPLQQLAYRVEDGLSNSNETVLNISSFSKKDYTLLKNTALGFYYPENPLFGKQIFENEYAAIYERSKQKKPAHFPEGLDLKGEGIVFIGFQARGSFSLPLAICNHRFKTEERERHNVFFGTVMDMLIDLVDLIDAEACYYLLEKLERYWYNYPKNKWDTDSWYSLIRKLIRKIVYYDFSLAHAFKKNHPKLVVCEQPLNQYMRNRKRQALGWMKQHLPDAKPVQDGFKMLLYDDIVDLCEKNGGFNIARAPVSHESVLLDILEKAVKEIMPGFFEGYPPCLIIENESATVSGMAKMHNNKIIKYNNYGYRFRYRLSQIEIKRVLLTKGSSFSKAFSTYCHELCHCFGGDASEAFSRALTDAMMYLIENNEVLGRYGDLWKKRVDAISCSSDVFAENKATRRGFTIK